MKKWYENGRTRYLICQSNRNRHAIAKLSPRLNEELFFPRKLERSLWESSFINKKNPKYNSERFNIGDNPGNLF